MSKSEFSWNEKTPRIHVSDTCRFSEEAKRLVEQAGLSLATKSNSEVILSSPTASASDSDRNANLISIALVENENDLIQASRNKVDGLIIWPTSPWALRWRIQEICHRPSGATTNRISWPTDARLEAELRVRAMKIYSDLFTSSSDGIAAIDHDGTILFANPKALELLQLKDEDIIGKRAQDFLALRKPLRYQKAWLKTLRTGKSQSADIPITIGRSDKVFEVSMSRLKDSEGSIFVTFRDVTVERRVANALVKTKDFLESLIDATVHAIIAVKMDGTIILFNQGAESLYGYDAEEVENKMNVETMFAPGEQRAVGRALVSKENGGPGRLESLRVNTVAKGGYVIPVSLSASTMYKDGVPTARVGIMIDLRDRLAMQQRLAQAQQQLQLTEKQMLLAELAGTAAHELNQPLTSVMNYAELLKRKLQKDDSRYKAAAVIVRESERMAEIVKKIGKITQYETKSYVGGQRILDLDRATSTGDPAPDVDSPPANEGSSNKTFDHKP